MGKLSCLECAGSHLCGLQMFLMFSICKWLSREVSQILLKSGMLGFFLMPC